MFERYTESARRALFFARYEASELGGVSIETEHVLLGLLREGTVLRLLAGSNVSPDTLRTELKTRAVCQERIPASVEIPFSEGTKRSLQFTADEANRLRHSHIGPEHMLLGLLREEKSVAGSILVANGLRLDLLRKEIEELPADALQSPSAQQHFSGPEGQIEMARRLVEQAGQTAGDSPAVRELIDRIRRDLDALKKHLS